MNENYMKPAVAQKYVEIEVFNEKSIESFKNEIANLEIHNKLDKTLNRDPNHNYKIFQRYFKLQSPNTSPNESGSLISVAIKKKNG